MDPGRRHLGAPLLHGNAPAEHPGRAGLRHRRDRLRPRSAGRGLGIATDTGQVPLVWQSGRDVSGWSKTTLPDAGKAGAAAAVRCAATTCAVAGRVDGTLALWQMTDGRWSRLAGLPPIAVGDDDRLAAPLSPDGPVTEIVSDRGQVKVVAAAGETTTVRTAAGPTGAVTAAVQVGPSVYVIAGGPAGPTLWQADAAALR